MANSNITKQFPDLFVGKTIMYVHGFGSSAQSGTVRLIAECFPSARVVAYDVPVHPEEAIALLKQKCEEEKPDLIIGTSMGGMYTEMLRGYDRILVNPAFQMGDTMHEHDMMGKQQFQNPRQDGVQEFIVTKALVKEYRAMTEQCFRGLRTAELQSEGEDASVPMLTDAQQAEEQRHVWGLFGNHDTVVHTYDLFCQHYSQAAHFEGEHRMDDRSFLHGVVPVIRWIDDRQEQRQRPVVFIHSNTFYDSYGQFKSSFMKAVEMLLEHYNVYFVGGPLKGDYTFTYHHVITCDNKALLLGDYFIDAEPDDNFMGTNIEFGSDEFKTWEEVITFFERLGGQ